METVSFVILHYGDRKITDSCIKSILKMEYPEKIRIIVVDNDISKKDEERKKCMIPYAGDPRITVLTIRENGGFSYANNQGYRYAREKQKAAYIVVLNNDIEFLQRDFLQKMTSAYEKHPCHILGPDIIRESTGEHQNPMDTRIRTRKEAAYTVRMNRMALLFFPLIYPALSKKLENEKKGKRIRNKQNTAFYKDIQEGIVPFGACLIFTPDFVKKEKLAFVPQTQFFYEEYILAYRCRKKGYHIVYDPSLMVFHESGAATKKKCQNEKKRIRFMLERTKEAAEIYLKMLTGG